MAEIYMDVGENLAEVPVNIMPLLDASDFKTIKDAVVYNQAGLALFWNFVTVAGAQTCTAVTPTSGGSHPWTDQGTSGMYAIAIPASGGSSISNDTAGFGWFSGVATGILPWRGPVICFRAMEMNDSLIDFATKGLLAPTVAGRTLDVAATGEAGLDFNNIAGGTVLSATGAGIVGNATKDSTTYRMSAWLVVNGAIIPGASLSNAAVTWYDKEGDTDLTWLGTPAVASTGCISGAGTMTDPGDNKPISVKVSVDYAGTTYSGIIPVSRPA